MDAWIQTILTIIGSVFASSGFWAFIQYRLSKKQTEDTAQMQMLRGLAHAKIIEIGKEYISRGWISFDEYHDFVKYFYEPYEKLGGNGLARKIYEQVSKLPLRPEPSTDYEEEN